jgi:hypothetical protein
MGGRVRRDSEIGRGSTFWVEFPLPPDTPVQRSASEARHGRFDFSGFRVLVTDDHALGQHSMAKRLEKNGVTVDVVVT